jgi:hypothetical protein
MVTPAISTLACPTPLLSILLPPIAVKATMLLLHCMPWVSAVVLDTIDLLAPVSNMAVTGMEFNKIDTFNRETSLFSWYMSLPGIQEMTGVFSQSTGGALNMSESLSGSLTS